MNAFFDAVQEYIDAAKAKGQDLAEKGANALEELAGWLRSQANNPVGAAPAVDKTRLAALETECQSLSAPPTQASGAKTGAIGATPAAPVGGPFAGLLAKLIAAILAALK